MGGAQEIVSVVRGRKASRQRWRAGVELKGKGEAGVEV